GRLQLPPRRLARPLGQPRRRTGSARERALHADRCRYDSLRGDAERPRELHATVDDACLSLAAQGSEEADSRVRVPGLRRELARSARAAGGAMTSRAATRVVIAVATVLCTLLGSTSVSAQDVFRAALPAGPPPEPGPITRMPDGKPDLSGNWSIAVSIGDISAHIVRIDGEPVDADERAIPYTPVYAQLRAEAESRAYEEPELHCFMSGVPSHLWRQAYSG